MYKIKKGYYFIFFIISSVAFCEVKITPVARLDILGGQYFIEDKSTSFGGNTSIFVSPAINFNKNHALVPILFLTYRGTKDVRELVGGGTLTQECLDVGPFGVKYVHKISSGLKLKFKTTYKIEYLKETKDEEWQKGLFDYHKLTIGGEVENKLTENLSFRTSIDYFTVRYPNYQSLVSKYQTSIDTTTYTEISENAGKDVLDYDSIDCFIESSYSLSQNILLQVTYDLTMRNFRDQHIVKSDGKFDKTLRNDVSHVLRLNTLLNFERITISLADTIKYYDSNQNSYDASFTKFTENSYDHIENMLSPSINFKLGNKEPYINLSLWWEITYRNYLSRLAQNETGEYTNEKLWQQTNVLCTSFTYPVDKLLKGLSFKILTSYNIVSSNMKYEKFYKYNYSSYNYFAGVEFKF